MKGAKREENGAGRQLRGVHRGRKTAAKTKTCAACGYRGESGAVVEQLIIPPEIAGQVETSGSGTVPLCTNCRIELLAWFSKKVSSLAYDARAKRFRPRSAEQMAEEYEATYKAFAKYKKRKLKID